MGLDTPKSKVQQPPVSARCETCGSADVSSLPTFALGCGVAYRGIADDVVCRRCGCMGPPAYAATVKTKSE